MMLRLLPLFVGAALFAEAPRPRPGFEGVGVRFTYASASGKGEAEDRATGFEVTGNFPLLKSGSWQYDWGFRYAQTRHDWSAAPVDFALVRGASLNLSGYASTEAGRTRYAVVQINGAAAEGVSLGDAITIQALYGADWRRSETFTLGYLFLAETRAVRSPMILVVPTFRWQFAPDWSLGTGRKSLVLERKLDEAWRASITLAYQQEEARLADLAGQRQEYESERVAALFGLRRTADGRIDEITLGWAFRARARREVGGVESEYDLASGALISLGSRWRF
ncbi:MAG: hypothetical protein EBU04_08985 [Verrucomicrobia bacterium]|nr:hypothetical protein [Verrucomicrobiota bacterium]NBS04934.1 hypothetical protein [Verrucomicrobiota bacterium]